jgi:putative phosphoribosyl transferase
MTTKMFENRKEAGQLLAMQMQPFAVTEGVLLAVPRGGVPVAFEIAKQLHWHLQLLLVKKIGHPSNSEFAIGAAGLDDLFIDDTNADPAYIEQTVRRVRKRLHEMQRRFGHDFDLRFITGKTVIVVDDGIATGNTLLGAIQILRKKRPARIIIAAPVISRSAALKLRREADEIITLFSPLEFGAVGAFYQDFSEVNDDEVVSLLTEANKLQTQYS